MSEIVTVLRDGRRDPLPDHPWAWRTINEAGYAVIGRDSDRGDYWLAATSRMQMWRAEQ